MSTTASDGIGLWWLQAGGEFRKLCFQRRTFIGFAVLLSAEIIAMALFQVDTVRRDMRLQAEQAGFGFDRYFSGLTVAYLTWQWTSSVLGPLFVAFISGGIVAGEVEDGTMRMLLCRPVARGAVLAQKFLVCVIYTLVFVSFVSVTTLVIGLLFRGLGGLLATDQDGILGVYDFSHGLARYFMALPVLAWSLVTIAAMAFMFSCFDLKPATASVLTLSIILSDSILHNVPFFRSLRDYFLSARMGGTDMFYPDIPWRDIAGYEAYRFALLATCLLIGWTAFERRDLKP